MNIVWAWCLLNPKRSIEACITLFLLIIFLYTGSFCRLYILFSHHPCLIEDLKFN